MQAIEYVKKNRIPIIVVCLVVVALGGVAVWRGGVFQKKQDVMMFGDIDESAVGVDGDTIDGEGLQETENDSCQGYVVDVSGSVVQSGVFCVTAEAIVQDALTAAGGISDQACISWIERTLNRAQVVEQSMKIYIPSVTDSECAGGQGESGGAQSSGSAITAGSCTNGGVNINSGSAEELDSLPGIGPALAQKIIESRPFESISDLDDVSGIGESMLEKLTPQVCL